MESQWLQRPSMAVVQSILIGNIDLVCFGPSHWACTPALHHGKYKYCNKTLSSGVATLVLNSVQIKCTISGKDCLCRVSNELETFFFLHVHSLVIFKLVIFVCLFVL